MKPATGTLTGLLGCMLLLTSMVLSIGCQDDAFCFTDCDAGSTSGGTGTGTGGAGGDCAPFCTMGTNSGGSTSSSGGAGGCMTTNGGNEICDQIDNDCNGTVDDVPGIDYNSIISCGTCETNCLQILLNNDPATMVCDPGPNPGPPPNGVPGTCTGQCVQDWYDLNGNGDCEYYCIGGVASEDVCNNIDDDCDGFKDEDVPVCSSVTDCGKCGNNCVVLHGSPTCVNNGMMPCDETNTQCQIASCQCPDAQGNCWWDIDGNYATGCEYQCQLTNGGIEICGDGLDNDCDGLIDGADDLSGDPAIGQPCFCDPDGECSSLAHVGITICQSGQIACGGANVLCENQAMEMCNGLDDDCDGVVDDAPTDAGQPCGVSNIFPCTFGITQCNAGVLSCLGAVNPGTETCNGIDDNCDGVIDSAGGMPPADSIGACNIPPPPPPGSMSACMAGQKACVGGVITCQGSVGPSGINDGCNIDANCDGLLTNQPDTQTDVNNCGMCGNNCYAGAVHSLWSCNAGMCQFQGCEAGYYDLDGDQQCEYPCIFYQAQEACNGFDDNCNGQIDEGVMAPTPVQVCGVSPSAISPECTSGVTVSCTAGTWTCMFPAGVCNMGGCASTPETCDNLDNNCNGLVNENVANWNQPCASDDGLPPPGHGACRTTGTFVCNGGSSVMCSAVKASCAGLPGGCTEQCDGIDNDCDSLIDEPYSNPGMDPTYFVRPVVTQVAANTWIHTHEASRPNATSTNAGSGNGYHTSAPPGTTIDKTYACSVPNKIPWFNVTPTEVTQTCAAMGGTICSRSTWQTACRAKNNTCTWGYNPTGAPCTTPAILNSKYCNLSLTYDFNGGAPGDQDGLLPTASPFLQNCWADWSATVGNSAATEKLFDITGNLREITLEMGTQYKLMGGAFNTQSEDGSACGFTFYTVDQNFKFFDTGFRCCFTSNPSP